MQPQAATNAGSNTTKLKMLCLHGYLQNAEVCMVGHHLSIILTSILFVIHNAFPKIFRSRMGSMRKALKSKCEFVFVDAPHVVDAATQAQVSVNVSTCNAVCLHCPFPISCSDAYMPIHTHTHIHPSSTPIINTVGRGRCIRRKCTHMVAVDRCRTRHTSITCIALHRMGHIPRPSDRCTHTSRPHPHHHGIFPRQHCCVVAGIAPHGTKEPFAGPPTSCSTGVSYCCHDTYIIVGHPVFVRTSILYTGSLNTHIIKYTSLSTHTQTR